MFSCPSGVGRLMRAAICGLLAATVIPATVYADSTTNTTTTTASFPGGPLENTCLPEFVIFTNATITTSTQTQADGTLRSFIQFHGTGFGATDMIGLMPTGSTYSFSDEVHTYLLGGPNQSDEYHYHYEKLIRRSEATGALGGDDSYLRVAFRVIDAAIVPDLQRSGFECR